MITDTYPNTLHDISIRSMLKNEDLGNLISEQRLQQEAATEREKELNIFRSGSAPPTVEGSLSSFGGLYDSAAIHGIRKSNECGFLREEDIRSDPAYANYYYSNVNLNPRLPPPLGSKEDWRLAQKLNYSSDGVGVNSVVGDGRKESKAGYGEGQRSLFSVQPGFGEGKYENGNGESVECGGDGLIGLPSLRLGMRQKSMAEMIQDDLDHVKPISRHPSRPPSRNAFDEGVDVFEGHFAHLRRDSVSDDILYNANKQGGSLIPNTGSSASLSYASAVGNSSRSGTPDPQLMARAPSPHILPIGGGRTSSVDRRDGNGSNIFSGISSSLSESQLVDQIVDGETHSHSHSQNGIDDCQNAFRMLGNHKNIKQQLYVKSVPSNSYVKGPAMQNLNGRSGFAHTHPNMDNIYSSFANYGLNGYHINPSSPSIVGAQLGTGNLPPLFDNTFAASAIGGNGLDAGSLGALDPNLMAAAVELHNLRRVGNQSGGNAGFQDPLMDPLYLQYLQSNEYVAVNKAANDGEYLRNPYMDLLQKGYLGTLLAPQKSQYGLPYLGKSGSLSHSFHGNSALGLDLSYPGSPLGGPLLPHSPIGSGSTVMQSERNLRFSSGMRNLSGGLVGGWNSESGGILNENFPSSLLDEFKSNKTRCFELSEIASHVVEFSADQYGSRFIQQKLETATIEEKNMVFSEIMPQALSLMTDVFGNYVIQKFFEHGSTSQIRELADQLTGHVLTLSLQMYGCRVIQKAIEIVELDQQTKMVKELDGHIMRCVRDQNGNHVIQKCIECVPEDFRQFIVSTFYDQVVTLSTHPYGCRVIQRVLEHCHDAKTQKIMMDEILQSVCMLAQDQYGNYVVQHVLEHGKPHERSAIITKLCGQIVQMSQQKFASNVIEKCLTFGTPTERQTLVDEMLGTNENEPLQVMMKDQFANYVVQKVLETCDDQQLEIILNRIKVHLNALKKYTYGKHIVARVEKLVAAGGNYTSDSTTEKSELITKQCVGHRSLTNPQ
ncbi:hypothetical protein K2173_011867 [Erythroxylum novogranatense]|uniref:PUM-HD domain-containing protein n=1 Tax=Erythroxylum novogranatense TaxID=1862640 RepID=A0AAV8T1Y8_9ROSI|nr:hypothetical protein K2173_011867 [Erythroxylum novogranatense]